MNKTIVGIYSIIHFVVDLSCAILVSNLITQKMGQGITLFLAIMLYDFFAFAMQFPIGAIVDKLNKNAVCAAIGCWLVALAFAFSSHGIVACIIAGIGNAMFHIGGGIDVLNISDKKAAFSGVFVSTGAMGIFLGAKSVVIGFEQYYLVVIVLLLAAIWLLWLYDQIKNTVKNESGPAPVLNRNAVIAILCLVLTVCIRSYMGLILAFEWKNGVLLATFSILAVVFGKMFGGVIGDKIGFGKISIISLMIAAVCFIFAFENPFLGLLAMFFFNMTMPITLTALSNILICNKGMAFGLLTLALFLGMLPKGLGFTDYVFSPIGLLALTLISALILYVGIQKYNTYMREKDD